MYILALASIFYSCQHDDASIALEIEFFLVVIPERKNKLILVFLTKFPIHQDYVRTTVHAVIFRFHKFIKL